MLPLGAGRFMHFVVVYVYQGADTDAEQLALTEQLFDAALGELGVVARGQPCMLVGDFNQNPLGFRLGSGLTLRKLGLLLLVCNLLLLASGTGILLVVIAGILWWVAPLAAAGVLSRKVQPDRWVAHHLAVRTLFGYGRWACRVS